MFCEKCGKQLPDNAKFCTGCGAQLNGSAPSNPTPPPSPTTTPAASIPTPPPAPQAPPKPMPSPAYTPQPQHPAYAANVNQMVDFREKPMSVGGFIGMLILSSIPLLGQILVIIWAFSSKVNKNKKNYAIAMLIFYIIGLVLFILNFSVFMAYFKSMINMNGYGMTVY